MEYEFTISTTRHQELINITGDVIKTVRDSGIKGGFCHVYIPHATAGVILNESADPNIKTDFLNALKLARSPRRQIK